MRSPPRELLFPLAVLLLGLLHVPAGLAAGNILYVKQSGNDWQNSVCSATAPCLTVGHAVASASAGDTIEVGHGTFAEPFAVVIDKDLAVNGVSWLSTQVKLAAQAEPVFTIRPGAHVTLTRMTISGGNGATAGGILNEGTLALRLAVLADNHAESNSAGAGLNNVGGALTMTNVAVRHNSGHFGLVNTRGSAIVVDSQITGTYGWGESSNGVMNNGGVLIANRVLIAGNQGIGFSAHDPVPNQGDDWCPDTLLMNVTISGNTHGGATAYGGANCGDHKLILRHVTVAANAAPGGFGGLKVSWLPTVLENSIVATNGNPQCAFEGVLVGIEASHSLLGDSSCGVWPTSDNLVGVDPKMSPLGYRPGEDLIVKLFYLGATRVHALQPGSPAIDTGADELCVNPLPVGGWLTDQLGVHRPIDGDGDGNARCDMGAYEYSPSTGNAPR